MAAQAPPPSSSVQDIEDIDLLLERYLALLDEYTTLRAVLGTAQGEMYHQLARANFAAQRGARYGRDFYDERMQAVRRVRVSPGHGGGGGGGGGEGRGPTPPWVFKVVSGDDEAAEGLADQLAGVDLSSSSPSPEKEEAATTEEKSQEVKEDSETTPAAADGNEKDDEKTDEKKTSEKSKSKDPLRWFGILTPAPLRSAQAEAIKAVEDVIPRLVSVNAAMADLEIRVRRARKRRAKMQAAAEKDKVDVAGEGVPPSVMPGQADIQQQPIEV